MSLLVNFRAFMLFLQATNLDAITDCIFHPVGDRGIPAKQRNSVAIHHHLDAHVFRPQLALNIVEVTKVSLFQVSWSPALNTNPTRFLASDADAGCSAMEQLSAANQATRTKAAKAVSARGFEFIKLSLSNETASFHN
jgi:hypothetical protein